MKRYFMLFSIFTIAIFTFCVVNTTKEEENIQTSSQTMESLSNKKIEWGIKRNDNHEQPDLGAVNKRILDENQGISMGNANSKKVYLTFDEGYEAGYTEKILEVLRQNDVTATFFITAHYVNTKPELVEKMIQEGHEIGNHTVNHKSMPDLKEEELKEEVPTEDAEEPKDTSNTELLEVRLELELIKAGIRPDRLASAKKLFMQEIHSIDDLAKVPDLVAQYPEWKKQDGEEAKPFGMSLDDNGDGLTAEERRLREMGIDPKA